MVEGTQIIIRVGETEQAYFLVQTPNEKYHLLPAIEKEDPQLLSLTEDSKPVANGIGALDYNKGGSHRIEFALAYEAEIAIFRPTSETPAHNSELPDVILLDGDGRHEFNLCQDCEIEP